MTVDYFNVQVVSPAANMRCLASFGMVVGQRCRLWANNKPALVMRLVVTVDLMHRIRPGNKTKIILLSSTDAIECDIVVPIYHIIPLNCPDKKCTCCIIGE